MTMQIGLLLLISVGSHMMPVMPSKADEHMPSNAGEFLYPSDVWELCAPSQVGMDGTKLKEARNYALTGGGSGYITRNGKLVMSWGDPARRYDLKSTTKSIGITALGLAIQDGKMQLNDRARQYHPDLGVPPESNEQTG